MAVFYSRISSGGRTTIPKTLRQRLGLRVGDSLRFRFVGDSITLESVDAAHDPFACFSEWNSEEDERLYRGL